MTDPEDDLCWDCPNLEPVDEDMADAMLAWLNAMEWLGEDVA